MEELEGPLEGVYGAIDLRASSSVNFSVAESAWGSIVDRLDPGVLKTDLSHGVGDITGGGYDRDSQSVKFFTCNDTNDLRHRGTTSCYRCVTQQRRVDLKRLRLRVFRAPRCCYTGGTVSGFRRQMLLRWVLHETSWIVIRSTQRCRRTVRWRRGIVETMMAQCFPGCKSAPEATISAEPSAG